VSYNILEALSNACLVIYKYIYIFVLNFMFRTDRRSPTGFLVRWAQTSPLFVVE